jgi:hypothetical protein
LAVQPAAVVTSNPPPLRACKGFRQSLSVDPNDQIRELTGNDPCPLCSTPNWNVYHTAEHPCPKSESNAPRPQN